MTTVVGRGGSGAMGGGYGGGSRQENAGMSRSRSEERMEGGGSGAGNAVTRLRSGKEKVEMRKPEVMEARALLNEAMTAELSGTHNARTTARLVHAALFKVLAGMSLGVDMAPLYPDMVKMANTQDLTRKKLVYMFLCEYARRNQETALLTVNTLAKDANDADPFVRGLAVRAMGSFRLKSLIEYVFPMVCKALEDVHPYVRKNGVLAGAKLFSLLDDDTREMFVPVVQKLLLDEDPLVCLNTIACLRECKVFTVPPKQTIAKLLSFLPEINEFLQVEVLGYLAEITPELTEDEVFALMDSLDDRLQDNNSAIVLAVTRVFLQFAANNPDLTEEVICRVKGPLLLLMATAATPEVILPVIAHLKLLVARVPQLLTGDFKLFFIKMREPSYIKKAKLDMLVRIASPATAGLILEELIATSCDRDNEVACEAIRQIGKLAMRFQMIAPDAVEALKQLLADAIPGTTSDGVVVIVNLLRKYVNLASGVVTFLFEALTNNTLTDIMPEARAAIVWALGEFGAAISDTPYTLEDMADKWQTLHLCEKLQLLTACVKVFFARPAEMLPGLGKVFVVATKDRTSMDLRDRASYYYHLLEANPEGAKQIVIGDNAPVDEFVEDKAMGVSDELFSEFNSISVLTGKLYADRPHFSFESLFEDEDGMEEGDGEADDYPEPQQDAAASTGQLLDMIDGVNRATAAVAQSAQPAALVLVDLPVLDPKTFQAMWAALSPVTQFSGTMTKMPVEEFVAKMKQSKRQVACIAAGVVGTTAKVYAFGQDSASKEYVLLELLMDKTNGAVKGTVKSKNAAVAPQFAETIKRRYLGIA